MSSQIKRRDFLRLSAATAATAALPLYSRPAKAVGERNLIHIYLRGAADFFQNIAPYPNNQLVTMPNAQTASVTDYGVNGGYLPVWTQSGQPMTQQFFETHKADVAVINGVNSNTIAHSVGERSCSTAGRSNSEGDIGARIANAIGHDRDIPAMIMGGGGFPGPYGSLVGRTGFLNQIKRLLDPAENNQLLCVQAPYDFENCTYLADFPKGNVAESTHFATRTEDRALLADFMQQRLDRLKNDPRAQNGFNNKQLSDFEISRTRAENLRNNKDSFGNINLNTISVSLEAQVALALELLTQSISRTVTIIPTLNWDTHSNNDVTQTQNFEAFFTQLHVLAEGLKAAGLYDDTVVCINSEFWRTPKYNGNPAPGRDHWNMASYILMGGGIKGGHTYGGVTPEMASTKISLTTGDPDSSGANLQHSNIHAALMLACGADSSTEFPNVPPMTAFLA